ncbi:hypothetical protein A9Q86_01975 [Flavobacteriales bacterium 33_180_T64]|nr:hypothetical protein A9Q86_01975 [Flavobacteriales bacterium 33_180_T64]
MKTKLLLLLMAVFTISINAQTQVVTGVNIGTALDYDGSHLYIAELFGNKISRIDLTVGASSYEVVTNISRPEGVAINGNEVYTAGISLGGATVADISGSLPATSNNIAAGGNIRTVVFDATHGLYLIKTDGSSNTKIYSISGTIQTFIVDVGVGDIRAATIEGSEMYLSSRSGGAIYKFDLNNVATPTLVKSGLNQPYEIDIVNNHLYFASEAGILGKFDLTNTAATPTIFVNNTLGNLAGIEVIGEDIYFTSWTNNSVYKINDPDLTPCIVNIPDANFKAYLVGNTAINTNGDTEIQCNEATAFTGAITVNNENINDLTGIEAFINITGLDCTYNNLTSLNVTQNTALISLYCYNNQLTNLNVSANTAISVLNCSANQLTYLDVSANTALTVLNCSVNQLTSLDVSANTSLIFLFCYANQLAILDVANGNNSNITTGAFKTENNPNLACIQVDNVAYSTANWTNIDAASSFSTNCGPCTVNIPDANFKNYLVSNTAINTNGDTEIQCSEASAFTGIINVNNSSISDLTGIEAFTALTELLCANNQLTSLDLSVNTALTALYCNNNQLTSIDVSNSTALTELRCDTNQLISIDVSNNTVLMSLVCFSNALTSLDVSANTALTTLDCSYNSLTSIDVSTNTALTVLVCRTNQLTSLDVTTNTALTFLNCFDTQLTSLDVSVNTALITLFCGDNNQLTSLNVANGNNTVITSFISTNNPNLTCITVDDVAYSTTNWTNIDAQTSFSTNCNASTTSIVYVNYTATGNNDGTTWADAYTHLENALAAATDGNEIWIATGTYLPNTTDSQTTPFNINNADLKIYGGFAGTETQLSDRVLGTNETILSGDFQANDVFVNDHFVNSLYHSSKTDNSRNIINITALANNLVLDGLTISNAHNSVNNIYGGAIIKEETVAKLTIKNCTIKNNIAALAAPGVFARFELNNAGGTRGELIIENSKFINNMSRFASGVYAYAITNTLLDIKVENSLFNNNIAGNTSTGVRGLSGAASWFRSIGASSDLDLKLINNTYVNHLDDSDGNSINNNSRAVVAINTSSTGVLNAEVVNCIFWNNYKPASPSNIAVRSITNTYQDVAQSIVVKNSIDQLNFNDASITSTVNTSSASPLFTNINNDLTIQIGSPAIDAGDNSYVTATSDLLGNQRVFNTTVDMGAYEFGAPSLGVEDNVLLQDFKLYPNPVRNILNIKIEDTLEKIEMYSVLGRKITESKLTSVDVSSLASGVYVLKVYTQNGKVGVKRFIKK